MATTTTTTTTTATSTTTLLTDWFMVALPAIAQSKSSFLKHSNVHE
jgi:hypothetical protein